LGSNTEIILAQGHKNIKASHHSTLEITKDSYLSAMGDCIIAVGANKGLNDLNIEFKKCLRKPNAKLSILVEVDGLIEVVSARGSENLSLLHPTEMVIRKSDFVSDRTLAVHADKAACNLSRELIKKLTNPAQTVKITLEIVP
jgi:uncharacterized protein